MATKTTQEDLLRAALTAKGWTEDRYGHMKKETTSAKGEPVLLRMKFQSISVRLERQVLLPAGEYTKAENVWMKVTSCYLRDVQFLEDGRVGLGTKILK